MVTEIRRVSIAPKPGRETGEGAEIKRIVSLTTWKYLKKAYFFTHWFPFHPFEWDDVWNVPKVVHSKLQLYRLHFVSSLVFYILLLYRCVEITIIQPKSHLEQIYVLFVASYFFIFILLQVQSALWPEETVCGLKSFFILIEKCEGNVLLLVE